MARSWSELLGEANAAPEPEEERSGRFARLRESLSKSRRALTEQIVAAAFDPTDALAWERLEEALRQSLTAKADARVCIDLGASELRRFAGALHVVGKAAHSVTPFSRAWCSERTLALPELNGVLTMTKRRGAGISFAKLVSKPVTIRMRHGGEHLRPDCGRPNRSLKNLLQEAGVPPWQRDRLPLLFCGGELVWVPGIGIDCDFQAEADETSVAPEWKAV